MIHASPLPDVEIPDVPLTDYVLARAEELGDKPALIDGPSGRTLTYGGLAPGRARAGRRPGGARLRARPDAWPCSRRTSRSTPSSSTASPTPAAIVTTINPTYTEREIHHQLVDADARLLVTVAPFLDVARAAAEGTAVEEIFVHRRGRGSPPRSTELMGAPLAEQVPVDADDTVVLPYSSGTTGLSKGVMLTHRNLVANVAQTLGAADMREDETLVAVLPFFHIYGMQVLMNCGLRAGATIVTMPRFDLEQFLSVHQEYGVTRSFVAPPIVVALAKHPIVDQFDLSKLEQVFSGAAPLSAELALEAGKRLGCEVVQGYGMTELSPVSHLTPAGQFKPGSVGVTAPNTEMRIVDPLTGDDLDVDEDGEIWVRGPQVMKGYLNNPSGHRRHDRRRRLAAHRRHRARRRRRPRVRRRPAQGAHQVQGLPGGAGRARGAAAHPPGRRGRRRDRPARRGGRRGPRGVRRPAAGVRGDRRGDHRVRRRPGRALQAGAPPGVHRGGAEVGLAARSCAAS